jgi:hypothetical protein
MPGAADVLVEERTEGDPGDLLHDLLEVGGGHGLAGEALDVGAETPPPGLLAEEAADHVEDERPLLVAVSVEEADRGGIAERHERPDVFVPRLGQVVVDQVVHLPGELVGSVGVPLPERGHVVGEALVKPDLVPAPAGEEVAEPLVGELIGHQPFTGEVGVLAGRVEGPLGHGGGGDVLHAAPHVVVDRGLGVLGERVGLAGDGGEVLHHRGGGAEGDPRLLLAPRRHVILDRDALPFVGDPREFTDHHRDQVGGVRLLHGPVERPPAVGPVGHLGEPAVAHGHERAGDRGDHLGGGFVVRVVPAREPLAAEIGLSLRPDLPRLLRIGGVRPHEPEPGPGARRVVDGDLQLVAGSARPVEADGQGLGRRIEGERQPGSVLSQADAGHVQTLGVEDEARGIRSSALPGPPQARTRARRAKILVRPVRRSWGIGRSPF